MPDPRLIKPIKAVINEAFSIFSSFEQSSVEGFSMAILISSKIGPIAHVYKRLVASPKIIKSTVILKKLNKKGGPVPPLNCQMYKKKFFTIFVGLEVVCSTTPKSTYQYSLRTELVESLRNSQTRFHCLNPSLNILTTFFLCRYLVISHPNM
jgi:hypothetical protein